MSTKMSECFAPRFVMDHFEVVFDTENLFRINQMYPLITYM